MALNFPSSPTIGQIYFDSTSGFYYEWGGFAWKSYSPTSSSNIKIIDDFSASFNGVTKTFPLTSKSTPIYPPAPSSLLITLNGAVKDPSDDYTVSGATITFVSAPTFGTAFSGVSLGPAVPINVVDDGVITPQKLSTGGPSWSVSGIVTATSLYDSTGNLRSIPQNTKTSSYNLAESDNGKHISITTGGVSVLAGIHTIGDNIIIYNNSGSNQTITQGANVILRQAGIGSTGNRTLSQYGVATIMCVDTNTFVVSGAGVT